MALRWIDAISVRCGGGAARTIALVARGIVASVLAAAVLSKLAAGDLLDGMGFLPAPLQMPAASVLLATEAMACLMLLWSRSARLGAGLGLVLCAAYLSQTLPKAASGVGGTCHCFGRLLPLGPAAAAALDVVLAVACLYAAVASPHRRSPSTGTGSQARLPLTGRVAALACTYVMATVILRSLGSERQARQPQPAATKPILAKLHEGEPAPDFSLVDSSGRKLSRADFAGEWLLLVLTMPGCEACDRLGEDLGAARSLWQGRLEVVMVTRPLLSSAASARSLERRWQGKLRVMTDQGELRRDYVDDGGAYPFSVLISPEGLVNHVSDLYRPGKGGIAAQLRGWFTDRPISAESMPPGGLWYGRRLPEIELATQRGSVSLRSLASKSPLLLTVGKTGCGSCLEYIAEVERTGAAWPGLRRLYLIAGDEGARDVARHVADSALVATLSSEATAAFGTGSPASVLVVNDRIAWALSERMPFRTLNAALRRTMTGQAIAVRQ